MINKDGGDNLDLMGGHSCYEGEHRAHGCPPSPPTRENPDMKSRPNIKMILNCCSEALKPGSCQHRAHKFAMYMRYFLINKCSVIMYVKMSVF